MAETHQQQIERILQKLEQVRRRGLKCFGSDSHRFRLNSPLSERALDHFEAQYHITLPLDYRSFLTSAGNGGAGPYYGLYPLDKWKDFIDWVADDVPVNILALPSPLHPEMVRDSNWESLLGTCVSPYQGMISIGSQGCTYEMGLIVTGEYAGRVVYLDAEGQTPYVVREPNFISWYERWLDELLGGYDMFWFGFGMGGDEAKFLGLLEDRATSDADRIKAIQAMGRLPQLSSRGRERICDLVCDSVSGVRAAACYVAEKLEITEATHWLSKLLHDESAEVRRAAISAGMKFDPNLHSQDIVRLMFSDDGEVAERAFFTLKKHERLARENMLRLVQSSPHGTLRYCAAHAMIWTLDDEPLLIRLLKDEHAQVRFYAVLGLRQIASRSGLGAAIELLDFENDGNAIDNILRYLGDVPGDSNAGVLLSWAEKGDDFHRLCAIESLCKLGDIRVEPFARLSLGESRSPRRVTNNGSSSHVKSIRQLVIESLRSSPNPALRRLGSGHGLGWLWGV